jgi:hypothetical protein
LIKSIRSPADGQGHFQAIVQAISVNAFPPRARDSPAKKQFDHRGTENTERRGYSLSFFIPFSTFCLGGERVTETSEHNLFSESSVPEDFQ